MTSPSMPSAFIDAQRAERARADGHLDLTRTQLHELGVVVGQEVDDHLVQMHRRAPVVRVLVEHDLLFRRPLGELHRSGADEAGASKLRLERVGALRQLGDRTDHGAVVCGHIGDERERRSRSSSSPRCGRPGR